jgi:hypothetical protein
MQIRFGSHLHDVILDVPKPNIGFSNPRFKLTTPIAALSSRRLTTTSSISLAGYSRKDCDAFAEDLVKGLALAGFAPFLDRHDIAAGEDWEARLDGLIAQSDTVVFVISPEAVKSDRCVWEVDRANALSKRLLPLNVKPVAEHDIPEKLRRLQFVSFDIGAEFSSLSQLAEALRIDLHWIREHTRLGEFATRWDARGRPESLLLRGDDLNAAKAWMAARKEGAPRSPTRSAPLSKPVMRFKPRGLSRSARSSR